MKETLSLAFLSWHRGSIFIKKMTETSEGNTLNKSADTCMWRRISPNRCRCAYAHLGSEDDTKPFYSLVSVHFRPRQLIKRYIYCTEYKLYTASSCTPCTLYSIHIQLISLLLLILLLLLLQVYVFPKSALILRRY